MSNEYEYLNKRNERLLEEIKERDTIIALLLSRTEGASVTIFDNEMIELPKDTLIIQHRNIENLSTTYELKK